MKCTRQISLRFAFIVTIYLIACALNASAAIPARGTPDPTIAAWEAFAETRAEQTQFIAAQSSANEGSGSSDIFNPAPKNKAVLVNIPLAYFNAKAAGDNFTRFRYFRTFGVDFHKPKQDGLYQYVDNKLVAEFIKYTNEHNIQVIWTLYMTSRTLERELEYVNHLINKGMNITAFEYGGEFYLPKYARADNSKKGVVEKVTADIYVQMLKNWLPAFQEILPLSQGDHIIIGASHGSTNSKSDKHRQAWNHSVVRGLKKNFSEYLSDLSWSFHLYMGRTAKNSPKGEENIYAVVDFSFMNDFPSGMKIFVTESGYYIDAFSKQQLGLARQFWTALYNALRPGDVFGIHTLINKGNKPNPLALIARSGQLTPVGMAFKEWLTQTVDQATTENHGS